MITILIYYAAISVIFSLGFVVGVLWATRGITIQPSLPRIFGVVRDRHPPQGSIVRFMARDKNSFGPEQRIFELLNAEHGYAGGSSGEGLGEQRFSSRETLVPMARPSGAHPGRAR